jgi:hypothetical protein
VTFLRRGIEPLVEIDVNVEGYGHTRPVRLRPGNFRLRASLSYGQALQVMTRKVGVVNGLIKIYDGQGVQPPLQSSL